MRLINIMDKFYEIVNKEDVEDAVSKIMNELGSLDKEERTVAIEAIVRLLVIQTKRAECAEAKYEALKERERNRDIFIEDENESHTQTDS